jgi:hypothetical protein
MTPPKQPLPQRKTVGEQTLFIALSSIVVMAIGLISFLPEYDKSALHTRGMFHHWAHFLVFAVLAYAVARTTRSRTTQIILFLGAIVFGSGIELAEAILYSAPLEWKDVLVDSIGVLAGSLVALFRQPKLD